MAKRVPVGATAPTHRRPRCRPTVERNSICRANRVVPAGQHAGFGVVFVALADLAAFLADGFAVLAVQYAVEFLVVTAALHFVADASLTVALSFLSRCVGGVVSRCVGASVYVALAILLPAHKFLFFRIGYFGIFMVNVSKLKIKKIIQIFRYFTCDQDHGGFVQPKAVEVLEEDGCVLELEEANRNKKPDEEEMEEI